MTTPNNPGIGQFKVLGEIGSGGMATVYKGYHERLDRHVAIKVMHKNFLEDPQFRARFEREARIVASLEHPNIVPVYDFDEIEGQPYLVMKYVDGSTLKPLLQAGPMPPEEILRIMTRVADALTYAHTQGVLHRDIKPSNILLDAQGTPYITDYGLARLVTSGQSTMSADVMLGTPHYISPEQAKGMTDLDARTDVYSLGVVLYQMVTGSVPYNGDTPYAIVHDHIYGDLPDPREINPAVPEAVANVLRRALDKQPNRRYETPTDMIDAYRRALEGEHVELPRARTPKEQPAQPRRPPPPPPPPGEPGPFSEAAREMREAWHEVRSEIGNALREEGIKPARMVWRPGAEWTTDAYGNQGFYTRAEIEAQYTEMDPDEALRRRIENRIKARQEMQMIFGIFGMISLLLWTIYAFTNFGGHPWPIYPMFAFGIAMFFIYTDYRSTHHVRPGRHENQVQRELERERARMQALREKPKHDLRDDTPQPPGDIRLTGDGEFTESFIDEMDRRDKDKRG